MKLYDINIGREGYKVYLHQFVLEASIKFTLLVLVQDFKSAV